MAAQDGSQGILKPIIIGVVTTVLSTIVLYSLNLDEKRHSFQDRPGVEERLSDRRYERSRYSPEPTDVTEFRRSAYRSAYVEPRNERFRNADELNVIVDRYNRTAKDIIDSIGR